MLILLALKSISEKLQNMQFDEDSVSLDINPVGNITLQIIERELNKTLKFETVNSPVPLNMWIQLLPGELGTRMKLTLKADLNPMLKMMLGNKLEAGIDKFADMLSMIPYA